METTKLKDENQEIEIDLRAFFLKLKTKWQFVVISVLICAILGVVYSTFLVKPSYQSTSMVYLRNSGTTLSIQDLQVGTQLTKDYEIIFKSRPVLEDTISELNLDYSVDTLKSAISITNSEDTRILNITVTAGSPEMARDIANSVMQNGIESVSEIDAQEPYIVEKAIANPVKVGMSRTKMTMLAALAGAVLSIGYVFLRFVFSDNVASVEDVESLLGVPVLAVVLDDAQLEYKKVRK